MLRQVRNVLITAALLTIALATGTAVAQGKPDIYPAKPIRLLVPFPPGGGTDTVARVLAQNLTETLGQQVVVDNRGGGGGTIGAEIGVRAIPDGYTVVMVSGSYATNAALFKLSYDAINDITEIAKIIRTPAMQERMAAEGFDLAGGPPEQLRNVLRRDLPKWMKVVKEADVKVIQ